MKDKQPEALRLADELEEPLHDFPDPTTLEAEAAAAPTTQPAPQQEAQEPSPTAGMNIAQRILHVGGRNPPGSTYVEFGSIQAVEALVKHVLRDLQPSPAVQGGCTGYGAA